MPILPVEYRTDERVVGLYRKRERFFETFARKEKQMLWELLEECYGLQKKSIIKTEHGYYRITDVEGAVGASISILGQIRLSPGKYSPVANMIVSNYIIPPISKSTTLAVVDEFGDSHDCVARFDNEGVFTTIGLPKESLIVGGFIGGIRIDEHGWRDLNSELALEEFVRCATFGQEDPNDVLARLAKKAKMKPVGRVITN